MTKPTRQEFPPGWNKKKVLAVIAHYDQQPEDEAAAEIELARRSSTAKPGCPCPPNSLPPSLA